MSHRVSLFEEGIEVIKRAWTEDRFSFHGKRYTLENVSLQPKPIQQPHPPIWLGGWTMEGVKRAGRVADPLAGRPDPEPCGRKGDGSGLSRRRREAVETFQRDPDEGRDGSPRAGHRRRRSTATRL